MLSKLQIPNAFAYGSPLTGNRIAVTEGLLTDLENEEIEAVIGHEVGHIVHRDMQVMMVVSCLPSLFYFLSRSFLWNSNDRNRRDNGGVALFGAITMLVYFALTLLNLSLSRQREYYADQHASQVVNDGARKLSEGLAKISTGTYDRTSGRNVGVSSFKTLMIADPDHASQDAAVLRGGNDSELVNEVINRRISSVEGFFEIFSTHPNIVKRLRALNESS
jgi:heat shock protein HtpX